MAVKRSFRDMLPPANAAPAEPVATEPEPVPVYVVPAAEVPAAETKVEQPQAKQPVAAPASAVEVQAEPRAEAAPKQPAPDAASNSPAADDDQAGPVRPHWTQLMRKEMRLFKGQDIDLKMVTMEINSNRSGAGERITDNTLVRVAVDLLLQRKDELKGSTEAELRESLNLPPRY